MKLLFCRRCGDVVKLQRTQRECGCGSSSGRYRSDGLRASYFGDAVPLGIDNNSLLAALGSKEKDPHIDAFLITLPNARIL